MSLYYQNTRTCSGPSSELLVCGVIHWHCTTRHRPTYSETPASIKSSRLNKPLSRRLDCRDRTIQSEPSETKGGNMYYVTMQITFLTRKFRNVEHNLHCDVLHITTVWVFSLTLDCNGVFVIKAHVMARPAFSL